MDLPLQTRWVPIGRLRLIGIRPKPSLQKYCFCHSSCRCQLGESRPVTYEYVVRICSDGCCCGAVKFANAASCSRRTRQRQYMKRMANRMPNSTPKTAQPRAIARGPKPGIVQAGGSHAHTIAACAFARTQVRGNAAKKVKHVPSTNLQLSMPHQRHGFNQWLLSGPHVCHRAQHPQQCD